MLIIEGAKEQEKTTFTLEEAISFARQLIADGAKPSDAAKEAAKETGWKKAIFIKEFYSFNVLKSDCIFSCFFICSTDFICISANFNKNALTF